MDKDYFSNELSKLITGYIDAQINIEMDNREVSNEMGKEERLKRLCRSGNFQMAIFEILDNPIFDTSIEELGNMNNTRHFYEILYLNISKLYEELKMMASDECYE